MVEVHSHGATIKAVGENNLNIVDYIDDDKNNKISGKYLGNNCVTLYNSRFGKRINEFLPKNINDYNFKNIKDVVHIDFVSFPSYTFCTTKCDINMQRIKETIYNSIQLVRPYSFVFDYTYTSNSTQEKVNFLRYINMFNVFGYKIFIDNYNATDFNIPQDRNRVCGVGILPIHLDTHKFKFPVKIGTSKVWQDEMDSDIDPHTIYTDEQVKYLLNPAKKNGYKGRILDIHKKYCHAITGSVGPNRGWSDAIPIPGGYRCLSVHECYMLQGLSNNAYLYDYTVCNGNRLALYSLVGNSTLGIYAIELTKNIVKLFDTVI